MRARIDERLERATRFPVTLIVAPAGFGKSVALRNFLDAFQVRAVRYDVRREDGTLLAFVRQLSEALHPIAPSAIAAYPTMQERVLAADEPVRQLSDWFTEHLKGAMGTLVIDDLHYAATDPASIALLADVIERTSEHIKWIIAARSDVGLPVATWIAYGRMDIPVGEDDLRFTTEEALAAAGMAQNQIEPQEVEALRHLTEGWPVALTIALRTRTHSADLRSASAGTRDMVYRYLAEQILSALAPAERDFLFSTCVFSQFDSAIAEAYGASREFLSEVRGHTTFLSEVSPGLYRYHDLFRDFLETELRRSGQRQWEQAGCVAGELLERRGEYADALVLYTKCKSVDHIVDVLSAHGFALFEIGETERLAAALEVIPPDRRQSSAVCLGLHAMIEAGRGHFELAERGFIGAIAEAGEDRELTATLVQRYAIELVRHDRDCVDFLRPYASDASLSEQLRIPLLGTLATAFAHKNDHDHAAQTIESALTLAGPSLEPAVLARLYQQAAYIYHFEGPSHRAAAYATQAIEIALQHGLYEVAARAYSVLYSVAYERDDPMECLAILEKLEECARKGASLQARLFALITAFELQAERGDQAALVRLDTALHDNQSTLPLARSESLLPANALRMAWDGDFKRAFNLLAGTAERLSTAERRSLRYSETALYAFAAGLQEEGAAAAAAATEELERAADIPTRRTIRARIMLALSQLIRGHSTAAHRHLSEAERDITPQMHRISALAKAARSIYRLQLGDGDESSTGAALQRLDDEHFGGLARLLAAIPFAIEEGHGYTSLTPAEREILQMLATGASTKEVASRTGRSPHTVDTHIRSICRKLACSGRREAVALAARSGWVLQG